MYQNYQYEVDPKDPLKPLYQGTFEEKVTVGGKERRYLVYIPKGARPSTAGVFILPENGNGCGSASNLLTENVLPESKLSRKTGLAILP